MKIEDLVKPELASEFEEPEGIELTDKELEEVVGGRSAEQFEEWRVGKINEYQGLFNSKKSM